MSSRSSTRSQPKKSKIDKIKNRKHFLNKLLVITAVFVVLMASIWYWVFGELMMEKMEMESYLKDRYGQEFVVENVYESGASLGSRGAFRAEAYPKSDTSLKFDIRSDIINDRVDYENFLEVLWSKQGAPEVETFLAKEFPKNEGFVLKIRPAFPVHGKTLSLEDAMKEHKDRIVYSLSVRNVVKTETNEPTATQLNNVLKIVNFIKAKGVTREPALYYNYRDASFNSYDRKGQRNYQYGVHIEQDGLTNVNTVDDIKAFFKNLTNR